MAAAEDLPQDLAFVDLETTGGNAAYDRITEVGILRLKNGELVGVELAGESRMSHSGVHQKKIKEDN